MPLKDRIVALREERGWSSGDLAEAADVSRAYLWQLETGGKENPSFDVLQKIARALGVSVADFTDDSAQRTPLKTLPTGLRKFVESRGSALGVMDSDIEVMKDIHFRGRRGKSAEDWELLYLFLKKWAR